MKTGDLNRWLPRTAGTPSAAEHAGQAHQAALHGADEGAPADLRADRLARRPVPEGYKRYLINGICEAFDMHGEPLRLFVRQGKNPYAGKVGPDGPPRDKRPRE